MRDVKSLWKFHEKTWYDLKLNVGEAGCQENWALTPAIGGQCAHRISYSTSPEPFLPHKVKTMHLVTQKHSSTPQMTYDSTCGSVKIKAGQRGLGNIQ